MTKKDITIIIPAYQAEQTLSEAIESVLRWRTLLPNIIIVNDGSTDGTARIANQYAERYSTVTVVNQGNRGRSAARNVGIDLANTEWIMFLDSDDKYLSNAEEEVIKSLSYDASYVIFGYDCSHSIVERVDKISAREYLHGIITRRYSASNNIEHYSVWGKLYRQKYIREIRFNINLRFSEDKLFNLQYLDNLPADEKIIVSSSPVYSWGEKGFGTCDSFKSDDLTNLVHYHRALNRLEQRKSISHRETILLLGEEFGMQFCRCARWSLEPGYDVINLENLLHFNDWRAAARNVNPLSRRMAVHLIPLAFMFSLGFPLTRVSFAFERLIQLIMSNRRRS